MDTQSLMIFNKIYEETNLTNAAKKLYMTPQSVSRSIIKLEQELNVTLFIRKNHGMEPTADAHNLYRRTLELIACIEDIERHFTGPREYPVVLGLTVGLLRLTTIALITDFKQAHPEIPLRVIEFTDGRLEEALKTRQVDLGIISGPFPADRYVAKHFSSLPVGVLFHKDHPLAQKDSVSFEDITEIPTLITGADFSTYDMKQTDFKKYGDNVTILAETIDDVIFHEAVAQGGCCAICSDHPNFKGTHPDVVCVPLRHPKYVWDTYLVHDINKKLTDKESIVWNFICQWQSENYSRLILEASSSSQDQQQ